MDNTIGKSYINILHLSDFHFGIQPSAHYTMRYLEDRKQALDLFFENFDPIPNDWQPDIIIISGDIGWAGKRSDYGNALLNFLAQLLQKTNLTTDKLIVCAGNHDKDTTKSYSAKRPVRSEIQVRDDSLTPNNISERLPHFHEFSKFLRNLNVDNVKYVPLNNGTTNKNRDAKFLYGHRRISGIDFIILNSAWDCDHNAPKGEEDKGLLRVGSELFSDAWSLCPADKKVVVTVLHHPLDYLHCSESEREDANRLSLSRKIQIKSQIILSGHIHHSEKNLQYDAAHTYGCGTLHSTDTSQFGCQIIKIDIKNMIDMTLPYTYGLHETNKMSWRWGTPSALVPFRPSEYVDFVWQLEKIQDIEKEYESVPEMTESLKSYMRDSRKIIQRMKDNENMAREELITQITKGENLLETANIYGRIDKQIRALAIYEQIQGLSKVSEIASLSDYARNVGTLIAELTKLYNKTWGRDSRKALIREIKPYGDPNARMEGESGSQ